MLGNMLIKNYVTKKGIDASSVNARATIKSVYDCIIRHENIYLKIGSKNIFVRDTVFQGVADVYFNGNYSEVYNLWVK